MLVFQFVWGRRFALRRRVCKLKVESIGIIDFNNIGKSISKWFRSTSSSSSPALETTPSGSTIVTTANSINISRFVLATEVTTTATITASTNNIATTAVTNKITTEINSTISTIVCRTFKMKTIDERKIVNLLDTAQCCQSHSTVYLKQQRENGE